MKFVPDKMGGSRKQVITLAVLGVVLVVVYFLNRDPSSAPATPVTSVKPSPIARQKSVIPEESSGPKIATRSGHRADDFRPSIKLPEGMDVTRIDPTLKLALLAKLQKLPMEGGARSVFDFGAAPPPPPPPPVAPIRPEVVAAQKEAEAARAAEALAHPVTPPPPPIPLKFYGYANKLTGPSRQAFFLDGEDIQIKGENDVIRGRYKIVRIGINSATVEDLQTHSQQTLPLVAEVTS